MSFQPILNQTAPMLIERGYSNAADLQLRGSQAMAQGISSAGGSIGNAVAQAASKWQQEAKQADTNAGMLSTYHAMNEQAKQQTGQGVMPDSFFEAVAAAKNKDQQSGMLVAAAPNFDSFITQQRQIEVGKASQKDQFTPTIVDLGNGRTAMTTSRGSAQALTDPKAANMKVIATAQGMMAVDPTTGTGTLMTNDDGSPIMPPPHQLSEIDKLLGLGGTGVVPGAAQSVVPQPAAKTPPAAGYRVGGRYNGKQYLGGDPNSQSSWK